MFLSVITPTYNRAYILRQCYESLLSQTDKDFEWIVVDDGSTDDTEKLVKSFQEENHITITYIKQANGGKHRAHNTAVKAANGDICVCVDSDDALSSDAVELVKQIWKNKKSNTVIGMLAKRGDFDKHLPICSSWPNNLAESGMLELQQEHGFSGDTVLFFDTNILKQHYFKEFEGEKFLSEDSLYAELDKIGNMLLVDRVLYYCEYLPDGLTSNYLRLLANNPMGTSYCYYIRTVFSKKIIDKLHNAIIAQAYYLYSHKKRAYKVKKDKFIMLIAEVVAPIYIKLKIKVN